LSFWRPDRPDVRAMLLVALVPLLLALPQLLWLSADPVYYTSGITVEHDAAIQRGVPYADPNNGFQTQALGYRAVRDWLSGEVPWWNPYSGVGMPLAAEYQPSAFFPLTFLLLLPRGMVLLQMALQILAGLGTYALLRQLGMGRLAATMGGVVYAVNGTLAWFAHGPASVVPWLPWFLYGIERAFVAAQVQARGGWRLIAVAMALSLLAGFPETAYINGLLALAWATTRGFQLAPTMRLPYAARIAAGGIAALAIASPQIMAFAQYVGESHVGAHDGQFASVALQSGHWVGSLVAPYAFGPIMGYGYKWEAVYHHWGSMGGYVTLPLLAASLYGFLVRRDPIGVLLAAWIVITLGKTFGVQPFMGLWNIVPGITDTAFPRYAQPSWELACVLLAARGLDAVAFDGPKRAAASASAALAIVCWVAAIVILASVWRDIAGAGGLRNWTIASMTWALVTVVAVLALVWRGRVRGAAIALALDAALTCAIPIFSNPRNARIDSAAIEFLRANLGLNRFFALNVLQPNYGAYFGIASINHNYLPVPEAWVRHVQKRLDRTWMDFTVFNGDPGRNSVAELRANLRAFENLGVKYVVTPLHSVAVEGLPGVRRVYDDALLKVFELPNPAPYFEALDGGCKVQRQERRRVWLECEREATLVRRELYFPGWTATVNGAAAPITARDEIFQTVRLPTGMSEVRFRYAPPHINWAWAAMWLGLAALVAPSLLLRRKHQ
jgi:hypothetical protein